MAYFWFDVTLVHTSKEYRETLEYSIEYTWVRLMAFYSFIPSVWLKLLYSIPYSEQGGKRDYIPS